MRVLELFSGIGGWRFAAPEGMTFAAAYDVSPAANGTYRLNHGHTPVNRELATIPRADLGSWEADTWVMSPPCQPYTRMGNHADLADPRAAALLNLLEILRATPPRNLVMENVEGFLESESHARLRAVLEVAGLHVLTFRICPTRLGVPNQRPRVYLVATREPRAARALPEALPGPLSDFLDAEEDPALYLPEAIRDKHWMGLDLVRAGDRRSACFIGGYGKRFVGSGSFLVTERGVRRFSPGEVGRLLGLPPTFQFPEGLSLEKRYKLLGNGLSIPVARWVLAHLI